MASEAGPAGRPPPTPRCSWGAWGIRVPTAPSIWYTVRFFSRAERTAARGGLPPRARTATKRPPPCSRPLPFARAVATSPVRFLRIATAVYNLAKRYLDIARLTGDYTRADATWDEHYRGLFGRSEYRPYEELEEQPYAFTTGEADDPEEAAENIIVYHHGLVPDVFDKTRAALRGLDTHLGERAPSREHRLSGYKISFLHENMLPELGSYLGEVLVRERGGRWVVRAPLMKSRVMIGEREINPYRLAYQVIFYGYRLVDDVLDRIAAP